MFNISIYKEKSKNSTRRELEHKSSVNAKQSQNIRNFENWLRSLIELRNEIKNEKIATKIYKIVFEISYLSWPDDIEHIDEIRKEFGDIYPTVLQLFENTELKQLWDKNRKSNISKIS